MSILDRIKARQPAILKKAKEIEAEYGDPIKGLGELLGKLPGSQNEWERFILDDEFCAWEKLSDEALLNFESGLESPEFDLTYYNPLTNEFELPSGQS